MSLSLLMIEELSDNDNAEYNKNYDTSSEKHTN